MNIEIMSRPAIEQLLIDGFPANTAVISFYDPPSERIPCTYGHVDFGEMCRKMFLVGVHDIDIEILADYGLSFDTYLPESDQLAKFILDVKQSGMDIICQCEYGQSRSAACAAAIREFFYKDGITIFADYRYYPNQLIFNKVLDSLKRMSTPQGAHACLWNDMDIEEKTI